MIKLFNSFIKDLSWMGNFSEADKRFIRDTVMYAVIQTRAHINNTSSEPERVLSNRLANIWLRTAQDLEGISDPDLKNWAQTLKKKAEYWAGSDRKDIMEERLSLPEIENTLNELCG